MPIMAEQEISLLTQEEPAVQRATRAFQPSKSNVHRRSKGPVSKKAATRQRKMLDPSIEEAMKNKILELNKQGCPATRKEVTGFANSILHHCYKSAGPHDPVPEVGVGWVNGFLLRYPGLSASLVRRNAHSERIKAKRMKAIVQEMTESDEEDAERIRDIVRQQSASTVIISQGINDLYQKVLESGLLSLASPSSTSDLMTRMIDLASQTHESDILLLNTSAKLRQKFPDLSTTYLTLGDATGSADLLEGLKSIQARAIEKRKSTLAAAEAITTALEQEGLDLNLDRVEIERRIRQTGRNLGCQI